MDTEDNFQIEGVERGMEKGFSAKKSLGQNFLHAPQVISAMVHASGVKAGDIILEAGPGKGALTEKLLEAGTKVIAVEKDDRAIPFLHEKFKTYVEKGDLTILHEDILEFEPKKLGFETGNYHIVANIPYYISGEFIRKFLETEIPPKNMVIMLQKELAKRITEEKGSILGISVKAYGKPRYITTVPRKFFRPIPNVDSAVVSIDEISKDFFKNDPIDEKFFFEILKAGFAHKRKVLIKNLEDKIEQSVLKKLWETQKWLPTIRAEELSLHDWKVIAKNSTNCPQK